MKYRKKPVVIEAVQFTGDNADELLDFGERKHVLTSELAGGIYIRTQGGAVEASVGDYIIKGIQGEFYPCKPDIFEQTYEAVVDENEEKIVSEFLASIQPPPPVHLFDLTGYRPFPGVRFIQRLFTKAKP